MPLKRKTKPNHFPLLFIMLPPSSPHFLHLSGMGFKIHRLQPRREVRPLPSTSLTQNCIRYWGFNPGALRNLEYPFITFTLELISDELLWTPSHGWAKARRLPIIKTIHIRHVGHCWRSKDELFLEILLWTSSDGRANVGRPVRTYIQQLCAVTECSPEDPPEAMNDREEWRERVRDIPADGATSWWWWLTLWSTLTWISNTSQCPIYRTVYTFTKDYYH